jgi:hypothetical protein
MSNREQGSPCSAPETRESPADLVGALQDKVHTDSGPFRTGRAVKETAAESADACMAKARQHFERARDQLAELRAEKETNGATRGERRGRNDTPAPERTGYERMFHSAVAALAEISDALGIPEDVASTANGNAEILHAIRALMEERDQLAAALEAAREDAERYRWLRSLNGACDAAACVTFNIGFDWIEQHGAELDAAIDQARGEGKHQ